jgi:hypothetical protein
MRNGLLAFGGTQYNVKTLDPRGIGVDPTVAQSWSQLPLPNNPNERRGQQWISTGDPESGTTSA